MNAEEIQEKFAEFDLRLFGKLRERFPDSAIGKLPKAGMQLDYVGHAAVTDRLLSVDPRWTWEPMAYAEDGGPLIRNDGKTASLWIRLTVLGVTRPGVGSVLASAGELEKQLISDALRNAAMRFGVALDLWSKEDLYDAEANEHRPPPEPTIDALDAEILVGRLTTIGKTIKGYPDAWITAKLPTIGNIGTLEVSRLEEAKTILTEAEGSLEPFEQPVEQPELIP